MRRAGSWTLAVGLVAIVAGPGVAFAQPSGFELSLAGTATALTGRPLAVRGVAYRVMGVAALHPLARGRVRARYGTDAEDMRPAAWTEVVADGRGAFFVEVPMPASPHGASYLDVVVGDRSSDRSFRFPLTFRSPFALDLVADRRLYEPGESVHLWARVTDVRSHRPVAGLAVRFGRDEGGLGGGPREVRTGESGVAALDLPVPSDMRDGEHTILVKAGGTEKQVEFRVGTRVFDRLFARVRGPAEAVAPGAMARVVVEVRTPSGAPVRGATVDLDVDGHRTGSALTGRDGKAVFDVRAPAYIEGDTGYVGVRATVRHPAHGQAAASGAIALAVPLSLAIEPIVPNAGLVPEVDGVMWLVVTDGSGEPAAAGTEIEVRGPAVRGRPERVRTDARGIAEVPVHLPRGAATEVEEEGSVLTTLVVHVAGPLGRTARLQVPVLRDALVVPRVAAPVIAAGTPIDVTLARRPSVARMPAIVEVLSQGELVASRVAAPQETRLRVDVPPGWLGVLTVRARPLVEEGVGEGAGAEDAVIVRPPVPVFPELEADRARYDVRDRASVIIRSAPGVRGWAAVLVRDLAAAGGEVPFGLAWLDGAFEEAVLDPATSSSERFLRVALAASASADLAATPAPPLLDELGVPSEDVGGSEDQTGRGVLRDPFPLADELLRRGIAPVLVAVEQLLDDALGEDRLDEITVGRGPARRFRGDVLGQMDEEPVTLGDEPITMAMLQAADPSFTYEAVARRVARRRLVNLAVQLAGYLDPGEEATVGQRMAAREPSERWLPRMVERGVIEPEALLDPWGGHFVIHRAAHPALTLAVEAAGLEIVSPGPDGRAGTADDVRDPFARAVPAGTPYAVACGEDELLRALSLLSSAEEVLAALLAAYQRTAAEVAEEEIGDAMLAQASEGALAGDSVGGAFGYAGLGMMGTGRGGGGSGSGTLGVGRIGTIGHGAGFLISSMLARVVRERFPATLAFVPSLPLDDSGRTTVPIALADAITTYSVEAVVWTADGFVWSARTDLRVDQEVTVDAPVPEHATVGDRVLLPVRVANRGEQARDVALRLEVTGGPAIERSVRVPAADATEVEIPVPLARPFEGHLMVAANGSVGEPLDAVRRPIVVRHPTRRVREELSALASRQDGDDISLDVPRRASALPGSEVRVSVGLGLFAAPIYEITAAWANAFDPAAPPWPDPLEPTADPSDIARTIAARWNAPSVAGRVLAEDLGHLTEATDARGQDSATQVGLLADALTGVAPVVERLGMPDRPRAEMEAFLRSARTRLQAAAARVENDPELWARAAAALALTAPRDASTSRVSELVRRVRRAQIEVGPDTWVAADRGLVASAWLAVAEDALGERERAFRLVATLGRLAASGRALDDETRAVARVAATRLARGTPVTSVRVVVDGRTRSLSLARGEGRLSLPSLGAPGHHVIRVEGVGTAPAFVRAAVTYGVPWALTPERPGPLRVQIEGEPPAVDERAALTIVVRNRSPRMVVAPAVQVTLFAGAELDEEARGLMLGLGARVVDTEPGTIELTLPAMPPGAVRRIPLRPTASVGGSLMGLGAAAWPSDRPRDVHVVPPRRLEIGRRRTGR